MTDKYKYLIGQIIFQFLFSGEDFKILREVGGPREHVMSWKYFSGDITSRVIHLYKYPDVSPIKTLNRFCRNFVLQKRNILDYISA